MDIYQKSRRESFRFSFTKKFFTLSPEQDKTQELGQEQGFCDCNMVKEEEERRFHQQHQEGKQDLLWQLTIQQGYILNYTFRESGQVSDPLQHYLDEM